MKCESRSEFSITNSRFHSRGQTDPTFAMLYAVLYIRHSLHPIKCPFSRVSHSFEHFTVIVGDNAFFSTATVLLFSSELVVMDFTFILGFC